MRSRLPILMLLLLAVAAACGRKEDPRPPELVRPEVIADLSVAAVDEGARLRWSRPRDYAGGERMDDLGGFLVFRGVRGETAGQIAEIPVTDRERFQQEKRFEHVDSSVEPGRRYYYRVVSFTTDGYYSEPSNQADFPGEK